MGCASSKNNEDGFEDAIKRSASDNHAPRLDRNVDDKVKDRSPSLDSSTTVEKIRLQKATRVLLLGDNRIKVATALSLMAAINEKNLEMEVFVGTRDPDASKNSNLKRAGVHLLKADMSINTTLMPAIKESGADCVFISSPAQKNRAELTISGITACRRAGVSHVVVISMTCAAREQPGIFSDQCKLLEAFVRQSGLSYTIVRLPILLDNYLSQLQSMAEYGIFYRPLSPYAKRNAVAISDVGQAVSNIIQTPITYADMTVSLNGPLTCCDIAATAFSAAFGRPIIYEQVSYESYKKTLLESSMPEWQADGVLELFRMFDSQEAFCLNGTKELEGILGRPPTDVFELAKAAVARIFHTSLQPENSVDGNAEDKFSPYSNLKIVRPIDSAVASDHAPAGIAGVLKVTISITSTSPNASAQKAKNDAVDNNNSSSKDYPVLERCLDGKYCILLNGVFTYIPEAAIGDSKIRAMGSIENRSVTLLGYVIRREGPTRISIRGSKGESVGYIVDAPSADECQRWFIMLNAHVEHLDMQQGTRWIV